MGRMKKRLIAWFMVMTMVVTAVPVSVLAANEDGDNLVPEIIEESSENVNNSKKLEEEVLEENDGVQEEITGYSNMPELNAIASEEEVTGNGEAENPAGVTGIEVLEQPKKVYREGTRASGEISLAGMKVKISYGNGAETYYTFTKSGDWGIELYGDWYFFDYDWWTNSDQAFDEEGNWKVGKHKFYLEVYYSGNKLNSITFPSFDIEVQSIDTENTAISLGIMSGSENLDPLNQLVYTFNTVEEGIYKVFLSVGRSASYRYTIINSDKKIIREGQSYTDDDSQNRKIDFVANLKGDNKYYLVIEFVSPFEEATELQVKVERGVFKKLESVDVVSPLQTKYVQGIDYHINLTRLILRLNYEEGNSEEIHGDETSKDGYYIVCDYSEIYDTSIGEFKAGNHKLKINVMDPNNEVVKSLDVKVVVLTKSDFFIGAESLSVGKDFIPVDEDEEYLVYQFAPSSTGNYKIITQNGDFKDTSLYDSKYRLVNFHDPETNTRYWDTVYCEKGNSYFIVIHNWERVSESGADSQLKIINKRRIKSINLKTRPNKTDYILWNSDTLYKYDVDFSGLSLDVEYDTGTENLKYGDLSNEGYKIECEVKSSGEYDLASGEYSVTVRLSDSDNKSLNNAFKINVIKPFDYIEKNADYSMDLNDKISGTINAEEAACFTFTPEDTGTYLFHFSTEGFGDDYLYDNAGAIVGRDNGIDNEIVADLVEGQTYYYAVHRETIGGFEAEVTKLKELESFTINFPEKLKIYVIGLGYRLGYQYWSELSADLIYSDGTKESVWYGQNSKGGYRISLDGEFMRYDQADDYEGPFLTEGLSSVEVWVGSKKQDFSIQVYTLRTYLNNNTFTDLDLGVQQEAEIPMGGYRVFSFTALEEGYYRRETQIVNNEDIALDIYDDTGRILEGETVFLGKGQKIYYILSSYVGSGGKYKFCVNKAVFKVDKIEIIQEPTKKEYVEGLDYCEPNNEPSLDAPGIKIKVYYSDKETEELTINENSRLNMPAKIEKYTYDEEDYTTAIFGASLDGIYASCEFRISRIKLKDYILNSSLKIDSLKHNTDMPVNKIYGAGQLYTFVPPTTGEYKYYSTGNMAAKGRILNALGETLYSGGRERENFEINCSLQAGERYYILVQPQEPYEDLKTTICLERVNNYTPPIPDITPPAPAPEQNITVDVAPEKKDDGTIVIPESITPTQIADIEKSLEQADTNKDMVINVPQSEGTATEIPTDIIAKAIESKVDKLEIRTNAVDGDAESIEATFTLDVGQGTELNTDVSSINTGIKTTIGDDAEKIVDKNIPSDAKTMKLELAHEGPFPVPVTISLSVDNVYKPGDIVYLYYINKESGKVELVGGKPLTVTADGKVEFTLEHASSYIITDKPEIEEEPSIKLNLKSRKLEAGSSVALKATVTPEDSKVQWKTSNGKVAAVNENGFVKALKPGTVTITASADNGLSATCKITVVITKMAVPTSVKAASQSYNSIKVTWKKVSNATKYYIYRATSKSGKYKRIGTAVNNSYTDKKLSTGKTYYYKVRAGYNKVYSSSSKAASAYPKPLTPVVKAKAGKKAITLSWKQVSGATGYTVYRADEKGGKYKKVKTIGSGKTVKYVDKSLKSRKTYYYKVRANRKIDDKKAIQSSSSKVVYAKTK